MKITFLPPLLGEEEVSRAVRARLARRIQRAAIFHRLIVEVDLLQLLEAAAFVHEGNTSVVGCDIIRGVTCINARAGRKIERRISSQAAHLATSRRATVDVLLIAQLVVVAGGVVALSCKEWLQTLLPTHVHR